MSNIFVVINFGKENMEVVPDNKGRGSVWIKLLDSSDCAWHGSAYLVPNGLMSIEKFQIRPESFILYERCEY
jgi:hypothetical protein